MTFGAVAEGPPQRRAQQPVLEDVAKGLAPFLVRRRSPRSPAGRAPKRESAGSAPRCAPTAGQIPSVPRMCRLLRDSAVVRASKLGWPGRRPGLPRRASPATAGRPAPRRDWRRPCHRRRSARRSRPSRLRPGPSLRRRTDHGFEHVRVPGQIPGQHSDPSRVTSTSSSMRTPMFHQRFGTPRVPGGIYTPGSTVSAMPGSSTRHWSAIL